MNNFEKIKQYQKETGQPECFYTCDCLSHEVKVIQSGFISESLRFKSYQKAKDFTSAKPTIGNLIYYPEDKLTERTFKLLGFRLFAVSIQVEEVVYIGQTRFLTPSKVLRDQINANPKFLHVSKLLQ